MIDNVAQFIGSVARTDLAKAARRSAKTIWNAHRAAFVTTRHEASKVLVVAIDEGQKFMSRGETHSVRVKPRTARKAPRRSTRRAA
jgi:hypothetical protein